MTPKLATKLLPAVWAHNIYTPNMVYAIYRKKKGGKRNNERHACHKLVETTICSAH